MPLGNSFSRPEGSEILSWRMPIVPSNYPDRLAPLSAEEMQGIKQLLSLSAGQWQALEHHISHIPRVIQPLLDVLTLFHQRRPKSFVSRKSFFGHLLEYVVQTRTLYWEWPSSVWETLIQTLPARTRKVAGKRELVPGSAESPNLLLMHLTAYLLADFLPFMADKPFHIRLLGELVFGSELVQKVIDQLTSPWRAAGYSGKRKNQNELIRVMIAALLINHDPSLEALTASILQEVATKYFRKGDEHRLGQFQRVLVDLHIFPEEKREKKQPAMQLFQDEEVADIHPRWVAWVRAFWCQTPISQINRTEIARHVLVACRWLAQHHPEVIEPSQWTKETAFQYVTYVCNEATAFDYASPRTRQLFAKRIEQSQREPLKPASMSSRLKGMRAFFRALQKYPYQVNGYAEPPLSIGWNPELAFATPEYVTTRLQPNPRNIEEEAWLKLIWTACTLTAEMVKQAVPQTTYPLLLQRAVALVWVTGCRRSDEICRLSLECVRQEWAPEMVNEQGIQLEPAENLWYLRVPANKYRGEFWTPIPQYTAEAILAWKAIRPTNQPLLPDRKTGKPTEYLFQYRRRRIGKAYITDHLIPLLCKAAGLTDERGNPYEDAIGPITSHRARASTAYYLKAMGMTPYDIGKLLGHTDPNKSLPWYLKENLHQLGRMYRKANPLDRTVHALLDTNAAGKKEPCVFYYLADGPDGRPRLCGNPNFRVCYHQLQCAECAAYIDTEMAEVIEKRPGVLHISVPIPLPEQLVEDLTKQEEGFSIGEPPLPPPLPGPDFHFNKKVEAHFDQSNQGPSESDRLREQLKDLETQLATKGKKDARNVSIRLLKQEIKKLKARLDELEK